MKTEGERVDDNCKVTSPWQIQFLTCFSFEDEEKSPLEIVFFSHPTL